MQELLAFAREKGFDLPPTLDGTVHRFPRGKHKDSAWMVGFQNHGIKDGQVYVVAVFGDWATREEYTYKPSRKLAREDSKVVADFLEKMKVKAAEEKAQRQLTAADKAEKLFHKSSDVCESDYLVAKKIGALYGARSWRSDNGMVISVPIRDVDRKLWGIQSIFGDGQKRFLTGQRIDGCFHLIGADDLDDATEAFICEGFATGASIHIATGKPVACAFNAGNMKSVAKALKGKWSHVQYVVAGDEDLWTVINDKAENPGRDAAERAVLSCMGSVVFPRFANLEGQPTDFNDLHVREGLEVLRKQLTDDAVGEIEHGFIPLGFDEGSHFFYTMEGKDIEHTSNFQETALLSLAPIGYWAEQYVSKNGINWQQARNDLIRASKAVGPFDNFRVRGTGVWLDDGRTVINTGRTLIVDGKMTAMGKHRSRFVYVQTKNRMPPIHTHPATLAEARKLIDVCEMFKWRDGKSSYLLAGWIALARIAAALPIRPHIWVTGGASTGKSTLMGDVIRPALGCEAGKLYLQGGSTEAGIRQKIKADSLPILFDEFETLDDRTREMIDAVIGLLRQSWSATQGSIVKGSAGGHATQYQLAFAGLVSSIRVNLTNDADRSRFAQLELAPHGSDQDRWETMREAIAGITEDLGERLFSRSAGMVQTILANYDAFSKAVAAVINQRAGQQYGMLLAGYWSLVSDEAATRDDARELVAQLDFLEEKTDADLTDETECIQRIMSWKIQIRAGASVVDRSIMEVVSGGSETERNALLLYGIRLESGTMIVANKHPELSKIFAGTRWAADWTKSLRRLPGAKATGNTMSWGGSLAKARGSIVPLGSVLVPKPIPF